MRLRRRHALPLLAASLGPSPPLRAAAPPAARAVELTFLKSAPGERERLKRFIALNWFAMDRLAKAQGLMHAYTVLDAGNDDGPWNLVVSVTYADERGYAGIAEPFERIRAAHRTVPVDGKVLRDLGVIVQSVALSETPADDAP